ncbi:NACHT domain-containing protein [Flavobacterium helocola]|uniref:NACHT domain-containing protein n=1 Tax=Flavobacterium helocola TaxID=3139139 RepID=A0ABU9I7H9_9FLAO
MIIDKEKITSELNTDELINLFLNILPILNFKEIQKTSSNTIEGILKQENIGDFKVFYMIFDERLSKSYEDIDQLKKNIEKKISEGVSKVYIVANKYISTGFKTKLETTLPTKNLLEFLELSQLIKLIDEKYSEYWRHNDTSLIEYEKSFENILEESFEIKKLVEYKSAHQKLLSIFIEPNLFLRTEDKQSTQKAFSKINIDKLIDENERLLVINGDPGVGKTRLLNEIGKNLIKRNTLISNKKFLPVFLDNTNLRDVFSKESHLSLKDYLLEKKLNGHFENYTIDNIVENYQLVLLIDSIDEFDESYQKRIKLQLELLLEKGVKVFIGTRSNSLDDIYKVTSKNEHKNVFIQKFNNHQVESFALRYFEGNGDRAQSLIESMKENKVLEKLPLTPLNLSLLSILYEETNQEVPSTLTDVYDKFSNLLLGRTMVDKSIDFLDVTLKENIIGLYALELLQRKNGELMTIDEFVEFIKNKLGSVSGTINFDLLPQALDFIIKHTGLLILYKGKYIKFRHDSYMEYFAAKEIFKNHRELEADLVDNFFDVNWQYTSVFYAGWSRKMPKFLEEIIKKVETSSNMKDYWSAANGMGYLLQSLYLTDDNIRKEGIKVILLKMVEMYDCFKKISSSLPQNILFSKFSLPVLGVFPIFIFQDNFDSITLKNPISMSIDELLDEYEEKKSIPNYPYLDNIVYRILILSITASSNRLNMENKLLEVIGKVKTSGNEFYTKLLEVSIDNLGSKELRKQKQDILKPIRTRNSDSSHPTYIKNNIDRIIQPSSRNRFTIYDTVTPNKKIKIFVEGPTDAMIIEHAYTVLTGEMPYWEIKVGGVSNGGANVLAKALIDGLAYLESNQIVIGLFDNDREGLAQFQGTLHSSKFDIHENCARIKKRIEGNIYAMLLPIPYELQFYIKKEQNDNYFSIEHYFSKQLLDENNVLEKTEIDNIFKVKDSVKMTFANKILKINDVNIFQKFILLFNEIDKISGVDDIEYREINEIKIIK